MWLIYFNCHVILFTGRIFIRLPGLTISQQLERSKSDHRNIQYAPSKVPIELWLEGRLRQSTICPQIYVYIDAKERCTDANNVSNRPGEYNINDTGLGTGKIRPQEG